ncbi:MAG: thioredoxin family protein [Saprospiraceae bacterium]
MRKLFAAAICIAAVFPQRPAAQGIAFEKGAWADLMAEAARRDQLIFVDAYAAWCGPCKRMDREVFSREDVGAFFNSRFVNAKIDMEKGEGPELAAAFEVNLYPTLLFIDAQGQMAHYAVGYHSPDELIELGRRALTPSLRLAVLESDYAAGERSDTLLERLLQARAAALHPQTDQLAAQLLDLRKGRWLEPANMDLIMLYVSDPYSPHFAFFKKNADLFAEQYSREAVRAKCDHVMAERLEAEPDMLLGDIQRLIGAAYPEDLAPRVASAYRISYFMERGEAQAFAHAAIDHYARYPSADPEELNEIAWIFYKNFDERSLLEKAIEWADKSVSIKASFYNTDTLAALHAKVGNKKKARKYALRAIQLGKEIGEDCSGTQKLLDSLR